MLQLLPGCANTNENLKFHIGFNGDSVDSAAFEGCFYEVDISSENAEGIELLNFYNSGTLPLLPIILTEINDKLHQSMLFFQQALFEDGSLELEVKVSIKRPVMLKDVTPSLVDSFNSLSLDLEKALEDEELKDASFIVGKKIVQAHKCILAARSPVFKKMLATEMEGTHHSIPDMKIETFEEMIRFIYTGKVSEKASEIALDLFAAAHQFEIDDLKKICEIGISENLNEDNAGAVLKAAQMFAFNETIKKEALLLLKR